MMLKYLRKKNLHCSSISHMQTEVAMEVLDKIKVFTFSLKEADVQLKNPVKARPTSAGFPCVSAFLDYGVLPYVSVPPDAS